ncbi:hypothetical protein A3K72_03655 [Candidatus Woesearchaeota archaeon RBG_13_36_6]|nr:MAG: hypothetical protein A3K72_03655 [Candidatus Woesearchaeota archaeon RBG_13_36_6]
MNFCLKSSKETPFFLKIKGFFGMISEREIQVENYFSSLKTTRDEMPFKIDISITSEEFSGEERLIMNIRSEPAVLFKMRQLSSKPPLDEFKCNDVIDNNKQFVNEIMIGLGGVIIEKPKAIAEYIKTPIIEKLEGNKFNKVANLLKNGRSKIERGGDDIPDGLTDLRSALEIFIKNLVERIGKEPRAQNKLRENLKILEEEGYVDKKIGELISNILNTWLWRYLSDKPVHKREKINLTEARFLFSIVEESINFLLNKVLYGF